MIAMDSLFPILIAVAVVTGFISILALISSKKPKNRTGSKRQKSRQVIIRDATKRLSQDPHSTAGLIPLSDLYFREHRWDKAMPLLDTMMSISAAHSEINLAETSLRLGICAVKLQKTQEALQALAQARKIAPEGYEVNFYLGQAFYLNNEFEKAVPFLKKALLANRELIEVYEFLGLSLYKNRSFNESLAYLKKALDANPESKELLFSMADAMNESGHGDRALKVFMHLRPDPLFGAKSCLAAGTIHQNSNQIEKAITDFEIGLRHPDTPVDIATNIRYKLAQCYLGTGNMAKALSLFKEIQVTVPNYKDVPSLINRYQELNQNKNLQTYLISGNSDFIALCRKIVSVYFGKANVKIIAIEAQQDMAEVQTEIETAKWEDSVVFRFYRNTGSTGELHIRDFHGKIRDLKAGRGICFTAGTYSDDARKYIDGRPIDLIEKPGLIKILSKVDTVSVLTM